VPVARLAGIAVAASLAQALAAILLVFIGITLLGLARPALEGAAEDWFAPLSYGAIGLLGLWLTLRGLRGFQAHGESCGHDHGPDPADAASAGSFREAALLVGAVALRPCTGALFLLIVAHALGLWWAGVAGTLAMGLGTASVTIAVAAAAALARDGAIAGIGQSPAARFVLPTLELTAGALIVAGAVALLLPIL
jgi:ABC-type nickel/cobalt efflux system permease component RcnA